MKMSVYEYLKNIEDDQDVADDTFDVIINMSNPDWRDLDEQDEYDKFCKIVEQEIPVIRKNGNFLIADILSFVENNRNLMVEFTEEHNREAYQMSFYEDRDDANYVALQTLESMFIGNYSESEYKWFNNKHHEFKQIRENARREPVNDHEQSM